MLGEFVGQKHRPAVDRQVGMHHALPVLARHLHIDLCVERLLVERDGLSGAFHREIRADGLRMVAPGQC
jgi:hypothetical protein